MRMEALFSIIMWNVTNGSDNVSGRISLEVERKEVLNEKNQPLEIL